MFVKASRREFLLQATGVLCSAFGLPSLALAQQTAFLLTIVRETRLGDVLNLSDCIYGRLFIGDRFFTNPVDAIAGMEFCSTLELPFRDNREEISACLPGVYDGEVRTAPTVDGRNLGWRVNLVGTPYRQAFRSISGIVHPTQPDVFSWAGGQPSHPI